MRFVAIEAVDTWHFGDSTPFAEIASERTTVFPPGPSTCVGAVRAALARSRGWNGTGRWPVELNPVLGDGPNDLASLRFAGPFVTFKGEIVVPVPRHVLGESALDGTWRPTHFLSPGPEITCDLGTVRLPSQAPLGAAPAGDMWLRARDLSTVLSGTFPGTDAILASDGLWHEEIRVGIGRDPTTRTVEDGAVFSTSFVRFKPHTALAVSLDGLPEEWAIPEGLCPIGGEGRMGYLKEVGGDLLDADLVVNADEICRSGCLMFVALTPVHVSGDVLRGVAPIPGTAGATLVSACVGRPVRYGGWSSVAGGAQPLRNHCAPGSVLFCHTVDAARTLEEIRALGMLPRIGECQEQGYGVVAVAHWQEEGR